MPASNFFSDTERQNGSLGDERALQLALELSMLGFNEPLNAYDGERGNNSCDLPFVSAIGSAGLEEIRSKKSQNMTECVPVPSSEHVAEIVGRQGCKIKALRAKTNTYIKTPVRGEEPVFVVTGRKEDVTKAKREILSAAEHFSQIRASRKSNMPALSSGTTTPPGPPVNIPGHITIQVRVPYRVVGLVVGPKGATIKRIQHQTHTYIVTPSRDKEPVFEVTGLPESVESAKREIEAHIAMRTGTCGSINNLTSIGSLDETDLIASLYKSGLSSILNYMDPESDTLGLTSTSSSSTFSSSSCSSSSSSSVGRDTGNLWSSTERDEGLGDSPSFDTSAALSSIWSYPTSASSRPSPSSSTSPADSLLSSTAPTTTTSYSKCLVCSEAKVTHALVPCGHNFFCLECATRICETPEDGHCPVCSLPAIQAIRIYSASSQVISN